MTTGDAPLPMFPLGGVLFPGALLPLHVFEPRYRALVRDCLAADARFGVVLIERGSEVGGGDVRTDIGTVATIVRAVELPDGRWAVEAVGAQRITVVRWLDDDPYPRAEVAGAPDAPPGPDAADLVAPVTAALRRSLALLAELGGHGPPATVELDPDPGVASHQASALAPLGPLDKQRLLAAEDAGARLTLLRELLADAVELLEARLRD